MSCRKFSAPSRRDALAYRENFKTAWQHFITNNFTSPEHAALVFGVDGSTARKWWEGSHAPSGFAVGMAYEHFPQEAVEGLRLAS